MLNILFKFLIDTSVFFEDLEQKLWGNYIFEDVFVVKDNQLISTAQVSKVG